MTKTPDKQTKRFEVFFNLTKSIIIHEIITDWDMYKKTAEHTELSRKIYWALENYGLLPNKTEVHRYIGVINDVLSKCQRLHLEEASPITDMITASLLTRGLFPMHHIANSPFMMNDGRILAA